MNSNKTVHSIIAGVGALTLALTAATAFAQTQSAPPVVWSMNPQVLAQQPPIALVRPTELEHPGGRGTGMTSPSMGTVAMGAKMKEIVRYAYNVGMDLRNRIIVPAEFEEPSYDFMDTMPQGGKQALQQALKDQFGLVAKRRRARRMSCCSQSRIPTRPSSRSTRAASLVAAAGWAAAQ